MDRPSGTDRRFCGLTVALAIESADWLSAGLGDEIALEDFLRKTLAATAAAVGLPADVASEVSMTLSDDANVREVNRQWRGKDSATNVLSFPLADLVPGDPPGPLAGDLMVAFETVAREAGADGKPLADHFRHLVVHGFLHLLGYDHIDDGAAETMEAVEIAVLAGFGVPDPYGEAPLAQ